MATFSAFWVLAHAARGPWPLPAPLDPPVSARIFLVTRRSRPTDSNPLLTIITVCVVANRVKVGRRFSCTVHNRQ